MASAMGPEIMSNDVFLGDLSTMLDGSNPDAEAELSALLDQALAAPQMAPSELDALLLASPPPFFDLSTGVLGGPGLYNAAMLPLSLPMLDPALLQPMESLLVPHNPQSFSSLETLVTADMPSPLLTHDSSDSSSDRAASPAWSHHEHSPDEEQDQRGTDLISSLTPRERDLLQAKGLDVSGAVPLSREEEKRIRAERRKIRNKDSAKESRRKKAEYMVQLEKRAEASSQLQERCDRLERENATLAQRLAQLQKYLSDLTRSLPGAGGTSLLMLLMTFCFAFTPSFLTGASVGNMATAPLAMDQPIVKSRVLLSIPDTCPPESPTASGLAATPAFMRVRRGSLAEKMSFLGARRMPSILASNPQYMGVETAVVDADSMERAVLAAATDNDGGVLVDPSNETQMPTPETFYSYAGTYEPVEVVNVLSVADALVQSQ